MNNSNTSTPKLEKPGAGLNPLYSFLARYFVGPFASRLTSNSKIKSNYLNSTNLIISTVSRIPAKYRNEKILIDPLLGIEDSSRYWSINDVLEHLFIVTEGMEFVIINLSAGITIDRVLKIAEVKPKGSDQDLFNTFKDLMPNLMQKIEQKLQDPKLNFNANNTFLHPWFGDFTARQWYWLLSFHQHIHSRQVNEIAKILIKKYL